MDCLADIHGRTTPLPLARTLRHQHGYRGIGGVPVLQQIIAASSAERGSWPRPGDQFHAGHVSGAAGAPGPAAFINELARQMGLEVQDLVDAWGRGAAPLAFPTEPISDGGVFHARLMPAGWSDREASSYDPGSLFSFVG